MSLRTLLFLSTIICAGCSSHTPDKNKNCELATLSATLQDLGICLDVNEQTWNDTLLINPRVQSDWRYFCDSSYFKIHGISYSIPCEEIFLLEVMINHGSGEYDNYIIKREETGYKIITEFKGYLHELTPSTGPYFSLVYSFNITPDKRCLVSGVFDGIILKTDSVLSSSDSSGTCSTAFIKGKAWN